MTESAEQALVIDNGSGICKAGFSGEEQPRCVIPEIIGRPKVKNVVVGLETKDVFVGAEALQKRGILRLAYPIDHGIITNYDDMSQIWHHVFYHQLRVKPEEHPVLLTEAPLNPSENKKHMFQTMFEKFNVPKLYVGVQAVLALYASGRTTGLIVDSGDGVTHCVPIYEGYCLSHAIDKIMLAGRDLTQYMIKLLKETVFVAETTAEEDIVRDIKEQTAYVAMNPKAEEKNGSKISKTYKLPDGKIITLDHQRYQCGELLFNPGLIGKEIPNIAALSNSCIEKCDIDLRTAFRENVILSGGSTMFPGFPERLQFEMQWLASGSKRDAQNEKIIGDNNDKDGTSVEVKVFASKDRKYMVWLGGAVVTTFSTFADKWITKKEYEECGADKSELIKKLNN